MIGQSGICTHDSLEYGGFQDPMPYYSAIRPNKKNLKEKNTKKYNKIKEAKFKNEDPKKP